MKCPKTSERLLKWYNLLFFIWADFIESEVNTNDGRLDAVVKTNYYIYVLEFKLNKDSETALQQIKDTGYAENIIRY